MLASLPLPRITEPPTEEDFTRNWLERRQAVIIGDGVKGWPALQRWNLTYLADRCGDRQVTFNSSNQIYMDLLGLPGNIEGKSITLKRFCDHLAQHAREPCLALPQGELSREQRQARNRFLSGANPNNLPLYLPLIPLDHLPELRAEVQTPSFFDPENSGFAALWVGSSGGSLHYDTYDGLLCQIVGVKRVTLFAPSDTRRLYLNNMLHKLPNHSRLAFDHMDSKWLQERFPRTLTAQPYHCELNPGDALVIPNGWLHSISAEPTSISVSWWRLPARPSRWFRVCNLRFAFGQKLKHLLHFPKPFYFSARQND